MVGQGQIERLVSSLRALGTRRLAALGFVGLAVFTAVGLGSYYLSRPVYETLYTGLNAQDISRIGTALTEAGIAFDVNSEGTAVMVPLGQVAKARAILAEKGLPGSANSGYELFDKLGSMGLTSFMQDVTRVRALEGEIARSIQEMKGVKAARVHLVLPDAGSFRRNRQQPSASVVIRAEWGGDFSPAYAIRHLVAAAVPGLTPEQVTVLSTDGAMLASGGDAFLADSNKMAGLEKRISSELQDNVRKTLAPYLGLDNFEISVVARLNTDKKQINETAYDPESRVERSVRTVKETGSSQNISSRGWTVSVEQNVPGEDTNTQPGDQSRRQNERREELTNYEINSKVISTVSEGYRIENLAVAVVVNRKRLIASPGQSATPEEVDRQLKEIERLAGSAAGVDVKRGDRITVAAVDFLDNSRGLEPVPGPGIAEQLLHQTGTLVNAAAILGMTVLLIWFGLRPAIRVMAEQKRLIAIPATPVLAVEDSAAPKALGGPKPAEEREPEVAETGRALAATPQKRLEKIVETNERQAAAVLKQWIRSQER